MIRYDEHAEFQMERRGIAKVWVEQTIREPKSPRQVAIVALISVVSPDAA
jgi:hypothetical protein